MTGPVPIPEKEPVDGDDELAHLAADVVALAHDDAGHLHVLLIERGWPPYEGYLALPGGHVNKDEDFEDAARRELYEETGVYVGELTQVGVYGAPGRDPRGRYVSVAFAMMFTASLSVMDRLVAGDDARDAQWVPVTEVLGGAVSLAFDHRQILSDAVALLQETKGRDDDDE